jgi:hypothetical protein
MAIGNSRSLFPIVMEPDGNMVVNGGDILQSFRELPYERLKAIKIEIAAPDVADPGQYRCLWKRVRGLVDLLSQSEDQPQIEIHLVEDPSLGRGISKWFYDGVPRRSIRNTPLDIDMNQYACDCDGVIIQFIVSARFQRPPYSSQRMSEMSTKRERGICSTGYKRS